ncbi:HNH endonuclease [Salmonella enterica]
MPKIKRLLISKVLARRQNAVCPACGKALTKDSGWALHYRVRWCNGGQAKTNNLILLHPACHDQYHSIAAGRKKRFTEA